MTTIRQAKPRDAEAIAAIMNQIIRETTITFNSIEKDVAEVAKGLTETDGYLVAEVEGEVIGFASFGPFRTGIGYAGVKEHSIGIADSSRVTGLGSKLLAELEKIAKSQGVKHMVAGVSGENEIGLRFHKKHGYIEVGHMPGIGQKFERQLDLVLMQKSL